MLRALITSTLLTSTLLLTACQSMSGSSATEVDNTQDGLSSVIAYNEWQWKYFSSLSKPVANMYQPKRKTFVNQGNVHARNWSKVKKSPQCTKGGRQSPIDIRNVVMPSNSISSRFATKYYYKPQKFTVQDTGNTVQFTAQDPKKSAVSIKGKLYYLRAIQYVSSSEHAIMGVRLPLELQLIHMSKDGSFANISVFVNVGASSTQMQQLVNSLPRSGQKAGRTIQNFNAGKLIPNYGFYVYDGSLTMPPCRENVQWMVATKALMASPEQVYSFQEKYHANGRPLQAQGKRTVYFIR